MRKAVIILVLALSTLVIAGNIALILGVRALVMPVVEQQQSNEDEPMTCSYEPRGKALATRHGFASSWHADCMAPDTIGFGGENREDVYDCAVLSARAPKDGTLDELPPGQVLARSSWAITVAERDGVLHVATPRGRLLERIEALDGVPLSFDDAPPAASSAR